MINQRFVLTAAHCVSFPEKFGVLSKVRLGDWDLTTNPDCVSFITDEVECNKNYSVDLSSPKSKEDRQFLN